ncbi:glycosyltransferase family 39 protein [Clostridium tyrobutyricum]|uniref:glycosyltransferase family 39 protein n=1 Tax=Clostridium tyrobutyricum TaxID=1519 RepID=UPI00189FBD3B|nr:glycosyltransferase family 39 protein [Clostridium tyrobutyricum]
MKQLKLTKEKIGIILVLVLSGILNLANLSIENYGNEYYAAGVRSMILNFKNFFFVSFDPAGFVSIDKPPLGFWIQAISAKIFGFSGWSILLPQALAGIISVALIYYIVKRSFGYAAGIIAAICLAITPVFVATSRNNTIDNLLVLVLLISCVFLSKAAEKGKFKYLIISLIFVGLGFNIKMLEAYMIGPAIYITYLISSAVPVRKRIKHLVIGTIVLAAVSLSWATIVDLVPSQNRPFVGSSTNNTVMELIFGHNGLARLSSSNGGMGGGPGGNGQKSQNFGSNSYSMKNSSSNKNMSNIQGAPPSQNGNNSGSNTQNSGIGNIKNARGEMQGGMQDKGLGGSGSSNLQGSFGGQTTAGLTRLFSKNILSDQIVWFLPMALFGIIASFILKKIKRPFNSKAKLDVILWSLWLIPEFIYFSYTKGLFHPYYLTMLAPPIAALSGIGITSMWKLYKENGIKSWLLPISFIVEGLVHSLMLSYFTSSIPSTIKGIIIAALVLCFAASAILIIHKIVKKQVLNKAENIKFSKVLVILALVGILTTPAIGASAAITHSLSSSIPSAGLELLSNNSSKSGDSMMGSGRNGSGNDQKLIEFLDKNVKTEKYALVVSSANNAGNIIIESGKSIMAIGGFAGSDNIISLNEFKQLVKKGEVRYVLAGGMGRSSGDIMSWVEKNGKAVSTSEWKDTTINNNFGKQTQTYNNDNKSSSSTSTQNGKDSTNSGRTGGMNESEILYDLKGTVK